MIDKFRFWLSFRLITLGVKVAPDEQVRNSLRQGMYIAGQLIEESLTKDESI